MTTARYYFDPNCPWTWLTSRWLVGVAKRRRFTVQWRPLSLASLKGDEPASREPTQAGLAVLRVVAELGERGADDEAGRFYAEWGDRRHGHGRAATLALVDEAAVASRLDARVRQAASDER